MHPHFDLSVISSRRHQSQDLPYLLPALQLGRSHSPPTATSSPQRVHLCLSVREITSEQNRKVGERKARWNPVRAVILTILSAKAQRVYRPCVVVTVWKELS